LIHGGGNCGVTTRSNLLNSKRASKTVALPRLRPGLFSLPLEEARAAPVRVSLVFDVRAALYQPTARKQSVASRLMIYYAPAST
jgi:hypothetical protein